MTLAFFVTGRRVLLVAEADLFEAPPQRRGPPATGQAIATVAALGHGLPWCRSPSQ